MAMTQKEQEQLDQTAKSMLAGHSLEVCPGPEINQKHIKKAEKLAKQQEINRQKACRNSLWGD